MNQDPVLTEKDAKNNLANAFKYKSLIFLIIIQ
jgi:hypothetical protein